MATCGGCEYCKEDSEGYRKMLGAFYISYSSFSDEWFINTGHCKPRQIYFCPICGRQLSEPPKGEQQCVKYFSKASEKIH